MLAAAGLVAAAGPLRWQPHPEVWFLVLCVIGLGFYVTRVIQPKMVAAGEAAVTARLLDEVDGAPGEHAFCAEVDRRVLLGRLTNARRAVIEGRLAG